ncbi:MAG: hypothetical protein KC583_03415, partial [Myxococcales bacterium]|nr:hypothetical protein [Myxococcales bacterium]
CHEAIDTQLDAGQGLHGHLGRDHVAQCAVCHSEHHGPAFQIVNDRSFAIAGVPERNAFDHQRIGFAMGGAHLELDCAECHLHADAAVLEDGTHRYLGLDQDCASCHDDAHGGDHRAVGCADCHGQTAFDALEPRDHARFLELTGPHAEAGCQDCHEPSTPHALESIGRGTSPRQARTCADCHVSPHRSLDETTPLAVQSDGPAATDRCAACHDPVDHLAFRDPALQELDADRHAAFGYRLDAPHDQAGCTDCHDPDLAFAERHPGRTQNDCARCHDDPHGGQFADSPFGRIGCTGCHEVTAFEPHAFGIDSHHAHAGLPLQGVHRDVACEQCHQEADGEPRRFRGDGAQCARCHSDAHRGAFDRLPPDLLAADQAADTHGACALCHRPTDFAEPIEGRFDHGLHTGFVVDGAHAQDGCAICHPRSAEPDAHGRTFGVVAERFGEFTQGCATCHRDPHHAVFDATTRPAEVAGRSDCARCHDTTSFRALPHGFDHGAWTGFALHGVHTEVGCTDCHAPLDRPDPDTGRTLAPAAGTVCAACHADPHDGQFAAGTLRADGLTDCARCHTTEPPAAAAERPFRLAGFDHETDARFPLGEAHRAVDCARCHKPFTGSQGQELLRYRPIPHSCADCHGRRDNPLRRRGTSGGGGR